MLLPIPSSLRLAFPCSPAIPPPHRHILPSGDGIAVVLTYATKHFTMFLVTKSAVRPVTDQFSLYIFCCLFYCLAVINRVSVLI